jgi:hypothetical protein
MGGSGIFCRLLIDMWCHTSWRYIIYIMHVADQPVKVTEWDKFRRNVGRMKYVKGEPHEEATKNHYSSLCRDHSPTKVQHQG